MSMHSSRSPRIGMALLTALVVMAVFSVIIAVVATQILAQRRLAQTRHRQLQADWLIRAGIERAAVRLLENPSAFQAEYKDLGLDSKVSVNVEKATEKTFDVLAEAEVASEHGHVVRRSRRVRFQRSILHGMTRLETVSNH